MERETKGFVNILSALISEEILQEIISQGEESTTLHEEKIVRSDKTCGCQQENEGSIALTAALPVTLPSGQTTRLVVAALAIVAKATIVVKNLVNMFAAIVEYCRL